MNTRPTRPRHTSGSRAGGFTLVELMVTISIALFLLGGLVRIVDNVRSTYSNQQALAQLQDGQRFAMTVIGDVVQAAGYFPTPVTETAAFSFPAVAPFGSPGQPIYGTHVAGAPDTLQVRYRTALNDGVLLCDGSSNTASAPDKVYTNVFTIIPPAAGVPGRLWCQVNNGGVSANAPGVDLVEGIQNMVIYYGVKRNTPLTVDYNVDTYLTADLMNLNDWLNVTSVKVRLTFTNPLAGQATQPATIDFERIIPVMGRAGIHS